MTIREFIDDCKKRLLPLYGKEEAANNNLKRYEFVDYFDGYMEDDFDRIVYCEVTDAVFTNCTSKTSTNRCGGGAIWTNAEKAVINYCSFTNCTATDQGGAVFHRIESQDKTNPTVHKYPYCRMSKTLSSGCTYVGCSANAAGGIETDAQHVEISDSSFTRCVAKARGGGGINVYIHDSPDSTEPSEVIVTNCEFSSCTAKRDGGGLNCASMKTTVSNSRFYNCTAKGKVNDNTGGGIYFKNMNAKFAKVYGCTISGCSASDNNSNGGGISCRALVLEIDDYTDPITGKVTSSSIVNCTSGMNGGGIYHSSNLNDSCTSIKNCRIAGCTANLSGGGVYTAALNADQSKKFLDGCTIEGCTAQAEGGGVYMANPNVMYVTVEDTTIKDCSSASSGGGLYSKALYLTVSGKDGAHTLISNCTSGANGGGIYHYRQNGEINVSYTTINGCTAAESGGGFYTSYAKTADFTNCVISNNSVTGTSGTAATKGCGGGILFDTSATLTLTDTTVSGNSASNMGGGIYTKKFLTLVCSIIENNQLTASGVDAVNNAAGVFMQDSSDNKEMLVIGKAGSEIDNSAVMNNTTADGMDSNLRMPVYTSGAQNGENKNCVTVNAPLGSIAGRGGYIGVTNARKVGTQFGVSNITGDPTGLKDPDGVVVKDTVFNADTSTLYGIISRTDDTRKALPSVRSRTQTDIYCTSRTMAPTRRFSTYWKTAWLPAEPALSPCSEEQLPCIMNLRRRAVPGRSILEPRSPSKCWWRSMS